MKKILALALVMAMAISFAACGSKNGNDETTTESTQAQTNEPTQNSDVPKVDNLAEDAIGLETEAEYIVFNASLDFKLESDAWLGVIPTGTIYENEVDADAVDVAYVYCENFDMDGAVSHRFAFEKDTLLDIEDGTYDLVLCSSDNEEIGKVLLQIGMEKSGDKITLDYENNK